MGEIVKASELTERQEALVEALCEGASLSEAAKISDYANVTVARQMLRSEKVAIAFQQRMASRLASGAPMMFSVLESIAQNKAAPAGARVDAAKAWLDRAGWTVPRGQAASGPDKPLQEMTLDELRNRIKDLREAAEGNLVDVTPNPTLEELMS